MILDLFENRERYYGLHKDFKEAFEYLEKCLHSKPQTGKATVNGDKIWVSVQNYDTTPSEENNWEGHRRYIDIQFVLSGSEIMEWANVKEALPDATYDEEKDFFDCGDIKDGTECKLEAGGFAILYPEDLHKPKCIWNTKKDVFKIVVKVLI